MLVVSPLTILLYTDVHEGCAIKDLSHVLNGKVTHTLISKGIYGPLVLVLTAHCIPSNY